MARDEERHSGRSPARRRLIVPPVLRSWRPRIHLLLMLLLLVQLVIVGLALALWWNHRDHERRGSTPPDGQRLADLPALDGLVPPGPAPQELRGDGALLVATCLDCRSGQIVGGFLARVADDLPRGARVLVIGWDGTEQAWRSSTSVPPQIPVHVAPDERTARALRRELRVGESGFAMVYDSEGRWVSTFHLGQLDRDDVVADLAAAHEQRPFSR